MKMNKNVLRASLLGTLIMIWAAIFIPMNNKLIETKVDINIQNPFAKEEESKEEVVEDSTPDQKWNICFENLLKEEGGYTEGIGDPGGETKYGISKKSYPDEDIKELTIKRAAEIYKRDFYFPMQCHLFKNDEISREILEQAVNMGKRTVGMFIQIAVSGHDIPINIDGIIGNDTIRKVNKLDPKSFLASMRSLAIAHYKRLAHENPPLKRFLRGWIKRVQT